MSGFRTFPYYRFAGAVVLGGVGGLLFWLLQLPLAWMLGSMTFCVVGAVLQWPIAAPGLVRPPMTAVIGTMLGSTYRPDVLSDLGHYVVPVLCLPLFILTCAVGSIGYFRRVVGLDARTAYFAGMPGGLVEMVLIGEQYGADVRKVALIHSARIILVVLTVPMLVQFVTGIALGQRGGSAVRLLDLSSADFAWFAAAAAGGALLGHALRLPAKYLMGPMLVSAIMHLAGLSTFTPPYELIWGAQVILGATIGCRFVGESPLGIIRTLRDSIGATAILLAITAIFAAAVSALTEHKAVELLLAYSPGGLTEMGLMAMALKAEVAFVTTNHLLRVMIVSFGASFWARSRQFK